MLNNLFLFEEREARSRKPNGLKDPCSVWEETIYLRESEVYDPPSLINLLENRRRTILKTIQDAEERYKEATEKLQKARTRLQQAKVKADEIRLIGLAQLDKEQRDLVDAADEDPKRLEDSKNYTIRFEKQRAIEQVRQQVSRLASERALESPNSRSDNELHLRLIDYKIGLLKSMEDVADQN